MGLATNIVVGMLIVSIAILGCSAFFSEMTTNYSKSDTEFQWQNRSDDLVELTEDINSEIASGGNSTTYKYGVVEAGYDALLLIPASYDVGIAMISDLATSSGLPIPTWLVSLVSAIFLVIIVVGVILAAILKWAM